MRRVCKAVLAGLLSLVISFSSAFALQDIDLTSLYLDELKTLKEQISEARDKYHDPDSSEESAVLDATKELVEAYFSEQGIDISWAWVNYDYTQEWDFFTLATHIDYKDADGKKHKPDVYAEVFRTASSYKVYYLTVGDQVIVDNRNDLPETLWNPSSRGYIADNIKIDLRPFSATELNALTDAVDAEIDNNRKLQVQVGHPHDWE